MNNIVDNKNQNQRERSGRRHHLKMATRSVGNSWKQLSFNLIKRTFSTCSPGSNPSTTVSKSKRKKKKNLFEVAHFLPNWGIGFHMAKTHWSGVAYQITKINLYKDGKHGKAWGIVHKDGVPAADAPKKISGVHKRCWKYIPNSKKTEQITSLPQPEPEVQAT
ncbi:putative mitochondrial 28S ribosomal protein S34 [Helianthus annuus]|uniref:Mitochondrial 28S ribosomal protein S34 n=2 Tax=Helianthus annuus TaxID=4232 RepID=A0A251UYQ8_HELAN|nr:putative mitochondrial 28S ribosomal protein S34 [Helianthus annuus]KAJ0580788.1 putative mitochondrial 28S ribosomal protein S34 [Helianthus annuus]KAJ0588480.1 putative mitochondrial 28S ribosomal protein S34 [Helianthus annuus]KAJ0596736.1 putative mitochondrial 28S ribosomal protein S34 [Helianthus annuus]KAJ0757410.1 putative mitochondrial 28S ribosomal protein S34 [Helianthus annuus]